MAFSTTFSGPTTMPHLGRSGNEPIDLTGSDNEDDLPQPGAKRARVNGVDNSFIPQLPTREDHLLATRANPNQVIVPNFQPLSQPLAVQPQWISQSTPPPFQGRAWSSQPTHIQLSQQLAALNRAQMRSTPSSFPSHVISAPPQSQFGQNPPHIIDLTRESPMSRSPSLQPMQPMSAPKQTLVLDDNLLPTTTILIGQITVSALVLNPVPYIQQQSNGQYSNSMNQDYVPVKLRPANENPDAHDILVFTPAQSRNGNLVAPESFAVVESKVSVKLQPLMNKRALKLEGMMRTVQSGSNVLVNPMVILVLTAKGNVSQIAELLYKNGLILERPGPMWSHIFTHEGLIYHNPHEGHVPPSASAAAGSARWSQPAVATKSVEVQRETADYVFQNLRGEEDLPETSPGVNIATPLYPHQKKALSFLLEREHELAVSTQGKSTSLWHCNGSGWKNSVTQEIVYSKPEECKGALLADDMGLGKTLETLCLLASTMEQAENFAQQPLEAPSPPEPIDPEPSMENFVNAVWDMPNLKKLSLSKEKKKAMYEKAMAEYNRMQRIKQKTSATLIICPLSTIVSWEDQIKDHWGGEVTVIGGVGSAPIPGAVATIVNGDVPPETVMEVETKAAIPSAQPSPRPSPAPNQKRGRPLRVYVYHGASRKLDAHFLAQFDVVITTYSTLSSEYSKQSRICNPDGDDDDGISSDSGIVELDEDGNIVPKKKLKSTKRKRAFTPGDPCSPLQAVYWFRVVLDEAHFIKEPSTVASRACCDLVADRRLCLTGTPLQNKVDDVYALIKFLRVKPFDDKATWTQYIGSPIKYQQQIGVTRLQTIMRLLALRRTKDTKGQDGKSILSLPPRSDRTIYLNLGEAELAVYNSFEGESQAEFMRMAKADVMKNYVNILQKILRLRQICDDVELMKASKDGARYDCAAQFEEAIIAIEKDGINLERASAIFALQKETLSAQCAECGMELASLPSEGGPDPTTDGDDVATNGKRGKKSKAGSSASGTRSSSECPTIHPIVTRCTHLYCLCCFRARVCADWPRVGPEVKAKCSICQLEICPGVDAIEVRSDGMDLRKKDGVDAGAKKPKRVRGEPILNYKPSSKVRALLQELMPMSRANPYSANYDPVEAAKAEEEEIQEVDHQGKRLFEKGVVKSVVFSQWTTMLDKIEDALETSNIHYERLDGTMKREERNKALDSLKHDPRCEVLLVSLKAGGVGLTLTAASRVYLMDPYWNPAVENQAVDRVHRLGQVNPVVATKFIIQHSIEERLLQVQAKKAELAKLTLGKPLSKQELQQRRLAELQDLLGAEGTNRIED